MASELTLEAPPNPTVRITARSGSVRVTGEQRTDVVVTGARHAEVVADGSVEIKGRSGSVTARLVDGAKVKAGSGNVEIGLAGSGHLDVKALSGSVTVSVPRGTRPATRLKTLSGNVQIAPDVGDDGEIRVKTLSGSIRVV